MRLSHFIRGLAARNRRASTERASAPELGQAAATRPFTGSGEMVERINAFAWSDTALGPIASWPPTLRASVGLILSSNVPMLLLWTSEFIQIYNDSFAPLRAAKHPGALGQPFSTY